MEESFKKPSNNKDQSNTDKEQQQQNLFDCHDNQIRKQSIKDDYNISKLVQNNSYASKMKNIIIPNSEQVRILLEKNNFRYRQNLVRADFYKSCSKTDWQSTKYCAKIGSLEAQLIVLRLHLEHTKFYSSGFASGQYGVIYKYFGEKQKYAVKTFKIQQQKQKSINTALKEVFIAKLASALKIGPKFISIFGYDAIIFKDSVQFAMEMGENQPLKFVKYKTQLKKDLMVSLKLLHSFQITHMDIKLDNIVWSQLYNKFVFIDYGFSKYIQEPIGKKSKTNFNGTFSYVSPEMKKLYFFKESGYVDLYYNDLFCLERVIQEVGRFDISKAQNKMAMKVFLQPLLYKRDKQEDILISSLLSFSNFKYYLFVQNYKNLKELILCQQRLVLPYRNLLRIQIKKSQGYKQNQIQQLFKLIAGKQASQSRIQIDLMFYNYSQNILQQKLFSSFSKLQQIANAQNNYLLHQIWLKEQEMSNIFYFLDVYSNPSKDLYYLRQKLIDKIYFEINQTKSTEVSLTLKFHCILLYMFQYFSMRENVQIMARIQSYFVLFDDIETQDLMQVQILKIYKKYGVKEYTFKNLEYFIGKVIIANKTNYFEVSNNTENVQQILLDQGNEMQQFIQDTVKYMKAIQRRILLFKYQYIFTDSFQFERYYLFKYAEILTQDFKSLSQIYLMKINNFDGEEIIKSMPRPTCKSQYLKNCICKSNLLLYFYIKQTNLIKNLLTSQLFLLQFKTIFSLYHPILSEQIITQIGQNYKIIMKGNLLNLYQTVMSAYIQYTKPESNQFFKYIMKYVQGMKINQIRKVEHVIIVSQCFFQVLRLILVWGHSKFPANQLQQIISYIQNFFQFVYQVARKLQKINQQTSIIYELKINFPISNEIIHKNFQNVFFNLQQSHKLNFYKMKQFIQQLNILLELSSSLIFWFQGNHQQALKRLQRLAFSSQQTAILLLFKIYEDAEQNQRQKIAQRLSQILISEVKKNKIGIFIRGKNKTLMEKIIFKFVQIQRAETFIQVLIKLSSLLLQKKFIRQIASLYQVSSLFVNTCSAFTANKILQKYVFKRQLISFSKCHYILAVFFQLYLRIKSQVVFHKRQRILKMCIYFVSYLEKGLYQNYKSQLRFQSFSIHKKIDKNKRNGIKYYLSNLKKKLAFKKQVTLSQTIIGKLQSRLDKVLENNLRDKF